MALDGGDVVFECLQLRVAYLSYLTIVALALRTLCFKLQLLYLLLVLLDFVDELPFSFPLGAEVLFLFTEFGNLLIQLGNLGFITLTLDGLSLYLKLRQTTGNLVEFFGDTVTFHA